MDILYNAAHNFREIEKYDYECILSYNRRCISFVIDFDDRDFFHLTGMQHLSDIDIPKNRKKALQNVLESKIITEELLEKSSIYNNPTPNNNVKSRIEHLQYLEKYLDTDNYISVFTLRNPNNINSLIDADYVIESRIEDIPGDVYIFLRERNDNPGHCAVVSFFEKKDRIYAGDQLYWMKKSKISPVKSEVLYQHPKFNEFLKQQDDIE